MIHSRGANASDAEVVWTQILQGLGGGFASVASSVAAQAAVPHADMAITTAMVLLWTEIGGAVGSAVGESRFPVSGFRLRPRLRRLSLSLSLTETETDN